MVSENIDKDAINVMGVFNSKKDSNAYEVMSKISDSIPGLTINYDDAPCDKILEMRDYFLTDIDLVLVQNLSTDENVCMSTINDFLN